MATIDEEIDGLYRLPASDFTGARNELAKRAGKRAAEVKALTKPHAAAWATNQLYWQKRAVFDALTRTSEAKRAAHVRQLGGKPADVAATDARHRVALDRAMDAAVAILTSAGDALSPATLTSLRQTLEALPTPEANGRLARPLEAVGFSMLSSLLASQGSAASARAPADVIVMPSGGGKGAASKPSAKVTAAEERRAAEHARKAAEQRKRERTKVAKEFDAARTRERDATSALTKARRALEQANRRIESLETELGAARRAVGDRQEASDRARLAVNDAAAARVAIERRLRELED